MRRRLLSQILIGFIFVIVLSIGAFSFYASGAIRTFYYAEISDGLESRAILIQQQSRNMLEAQKFEELDRFVKEYGKRAKTRITVVSPDGLVLADSDENPAAMANHRDRPEIIEALQQGRGEAVRYSARIGAHMMYVAVPIVGEKGKIAILRTSIPMSSLDEALSGMYEKIITAGVIILLIAAVVSLFISQRISVPVEQMRAVAHRFAKGELSERVSGSGTTELVELADSLNAMARELQKRLETITKQRNELEAVLASMTEGVIAIDARGRIVSMNNAAANFLQISTENARGKGIEEVIRNVELEEFIIATLESEQRTEQSIRIVGDQRYYFQVHGAGLVDEQGQRTGAVIVMNDVTRTQRLETVRRDFVANVSHELRTPITSIKGFVETLLEGAMENPEETKRFLEIISRHADRLNAIIEDLLSLSRLEESDVKRNLSFDSKEVKPVLVEAVELSKIKASEKKIEVNIHCPQDLYWNMNPTLLEQAVANLVDNAIKYSEAKSHVEVTVEKANEALLISVRDQGCGIPQKHLSRLFERFYVVDKSRARKLGGTGLGLAIVKHIAQVHGGAVSIESTYGKGSCFTIRLPRS